VDRPEVAHITNPLPTRDPLPHRNAHRVQMGVTGLDPELVLDLDQAAIARRPAGMCHDTVGGRVDRGADWAGKVGPGMKTAPALAEATGKAEVVLYGNVEGRTLGGDPVEVDTVHAIQNVVGPGCIGIRPATHGGKGQGRQRSASAGIATADG